MKIGCQHLLKNVHNDKNYCFVIDTTYKKNVNEYNKIYLPKKTRKLYCKDLTNLKACVTI